ncbi:MAG: hypothetical protein WC661_02385 [Opitutaceae bacterium]
MSSLKRIIPATLLLPALLAFASNHAKAAPATPQWEPCGWGGGGFYFGAAFHPTKDGVVYLGGNVTGMYKSEDHGRNWRISTKGMTHYIVHSVAVDRMNPDTVYASTVGGLLKSTDAGESWRFIDKTGKADLRITGERDLSIQPIVVDPTNGNIVYAGSPGGNVYKSTDGAQTWKVSYHPSTEAEPVGVLRVQFGRAGNAGFGGIWLPLAIPAGLKPADCVGMGFSFNGGMQVPQRAFVTLTTSTGAAYVSKNLSDQFGGDAWKNVFLTPGDFSISDAYVKKNPDQAKSAPPTPDWGAVNRMDFSVIGALSTTAYVTRFKEISFAATRAPDGRTGTAQAPVLVKARDFTADKAVQTYGNVRAGDALGGSVYSVDVAVKKPAMVMAATADAGLVLSEDAGGTWRSLDTPKRASSVSIDPANPAIVYGSFWADGVWKSTDSGKTWSNITGPFGPKFSVRQVLVNPVDSQIVYVIGDSGWNASFFRSTDAGKSWTGCAGMTVAPTNPTITSARGLIKEVFMSKLTNLAVNPRNPKQLLMSANWRPCMSEDGGLTWAECDNGADISVITDIRFSGNRTYVTVMDEGAFVSENNGKDWRQLWPLKYADQMSGHAWRIAVDNVNGADRIIGTQTPWNPRFPNKAIVSEDGGKTHEVVTTGLPDYTLRKNTMWGQGFARALAVDPNNPKVVYMGIDGDAEDGKSGGGVFKSADGGHTWTPSPNQPGSRRMFYGLAVDPTDSKRVFWGACGTKGGVYRSQDGGATWQNVFNREAWAFNVLVAKTGEVYCGGKNLWRSTDHGTTWTQLTKFTGKRSVVGMEVDPRDTKTMWISAITWDDSDDGGVFKTTDGGVTWTEITGDLPYKKPLVLRFNPVTNELWSGSVPLFKIKQ